jgi:putative protease
MEKIKKIEIQAPGKNFLYAKEAIKCGADSVYIGAPKYSMRKDYGNGLEDIKNLVNYAHKYWVKVYVPINCLLYTEEDFQNIRNLVWELYDIGVDAFIIQDIGILELDLPSVPIFLSTNTACFDKEVYKFFENIGVYRIIFPRELTYNEIREIAEYTNIDLETFCYGYLCVGISGQCYLAYTENISQGKSIEQSHYNASNHGVCTEPCMQFYDLYDADNNLIVDNDRLLNLKFLNLPAEIIKLVDVGVYSFKIAGREKDLKHVKNSVANYNFIANEIVAKRKNVKRLSSGRCILGFEPDFSKNFNKGFTDFFFYGRKKEMYSKNTLIGTNVGKVLDFNINSFILDNNDFQLYVGDKLRYKNCQGGVSVLEILDVQDNKYICNDINENITGVELYRYINKRGFAEVENSVNYRVISVTLDFQKNDRGYSVIVEDEDENSISLEIPLGTSVITKNNLKNKFYEIKEDCEFVIDKVKTEAELKLDDVEFLKCLIFEKLREERAKNRPVLHCEIKKNNIPYPKKILTYLDNVTNKYAENFYKRHGVETIEKALELRENIEGLKTFNSRYCLKYELGFCSKLKKSNVPKEPWIIQNKISGNKFRVECDCKNCKMHLIYTKK